MAFSDQMTPEEMQQMAEALKEAYEAGLISAQDFNEGMKDVMVGVRGYTAALNQSLNQLGTAFKRLGKNMLDGEQGMSQYDEVVSAGGDALAKAASKYGAAGVAAGALIKILTFGFSQISAMADGLYKANQDLSKAGAVGKEGMSGIFENMQKFGYGIADLGDMTSLIAKNSQSLGQFGGSVIEGTDTLANMAKRIKSSDLQRQFMNMGMSVNDINKGIAGYVAMQTSYGIKTNETAEDQARSAAAYIKQQDLITKMTGQSADQLEQNQAEAQQVEAWNAKLATMKPEEAAKYQAAFDTLHSTSKTAAMGFAASITGMTGLTKEASQAFQMTGGAIGPLTKQYKDNIAAGMDSNRAAAILKQGMADAAAKTQGLASSVAMVGGDAGMGGIIEHSKMTALAGGKVIAAFNKVVDSQEGQAEGYDKNTNEHTKLLREQMASRDSLQSLMEKGIGPVTKGLANLARLTNDILDPFVNNDASGMMAAIVGGMLGGPGGARLAIKLSNKIFGNKKKDQAGQSEGTPPSSDSSTPAGPAGPGEKGVKPEVLAKKAQIESAIGKKLIVTSGFRPGAANHGSGDAIDLGFGANKLSEQDKNKILRTAIEVGFTGIGAEYRAPGGAHIHLDTSHSSLVGWGSNYRSDSVPSDSPYLASLLDAKRSGKPLPPVSARDGAVLSGPTSGYKPDLTMHGTEAIVPMDKLIEMAAGKNGYTGTDITSMRSNVPIISPFDEDSRALDQQSTEMSYFDKEMMAINDSIIAALSSGVRHQKRIKHARI